MSKRLWLSGLIVAVSVLGLICSEILCRSMVFHRAVGRMAGRGQLVAITHGKGIYQDDLDGLEATESDLVLAENLRRAASSESIDASRIDREISLLTAEFGNDKAFDRALRSSGLSILSLREKIAKQLRGLDWLERQIAPGTAVTELECRKFYDAHAELFAQPIRYRASHLFLAAHEETPPEVVEEKTKAIDALAVRVSGGEAFSQLAAETSEDEATKSRGGDLGFFSASRVPSEFFAEVQKLRTGETSKPFRSHLGFHILRLDEIKSAHQLTFEEARAEISVALANERRVSSA
ncbi:MAG: hypothetical protein DLM73_05025, partial [Chthoniobacterales bacterium]